MTRHARNCTAGAVYTYHERKKDASSSGYGSKDARVGKDSQRVSIKLLNSSRKKGKCAKKNISCFWHHFSETILQEG